MFSANEFHSELFVFCFIVIAQSMLSGLHSALLKIFISLNCARKLRVHIIRKSLYQSLALRPLEQCVKLYDPLKVENNDAGETQVILRATACKHILSTMNHISRKYRFSKNHYII